LSWAREVGAVLAKEARTEWRTRVAVASLGLFVACSLSLTGLAFARLSLRPADHAELSPQIASALLWLIVLFTAATGLGRAFVAEEERGTALTLRLHARATAVWMGKFLSNWIQILFLTGLAAPVLFQIVAVQIRHPLPLVLSLGLGCAGVAAVFTTTGALVAQSRARGGLLAALSFPVLLPQFATGVDSTLRSIGWRATAAGDFWSTSAGELVQLASFDTLAIAASLLLFDYVWND